MVCVGLRVVHWNARIQAKSRLSPAIAVPSKNSRNQRREKKQPQTNRGMSSIGWPIPRNAMIMLNSLTIVIIVVVVVLIESNKYNCHSRIASIATVTHSPFIVASRCLHHIRIDHTAAILRSMWLCVVRHRVREKCSHLNQHLNPKALCESHRFFANQLLIAR